MKPRQENRRRRRNLLLGLGLDGRDGHVRVTRGDDLFLVGGSEKTHERMQETVVQLDEELKRQGKTIATTSTAELREILKELHEK